MGASAQVRFYTGASPGGASADISGTTIRYKQADNSIQDALNPLSLPVSGLTLSWRKSQKINFTTTPVSSISNLRWFMSGTPPTGITLYARVQATGVYVQANSGDPNGIVGFTDTPTNLNNNSAANYPSSTPLTITAGTVLSNPSTGEGTQNFLETQMSVGTAFTGGGGAIPAFGVGYRYTET